MAQRQRLTAMASSISASTRLGWPKQLIRLGSETLLERTICIAVEAGLDPVFVVASPNSFDSLVELQRHALELAARPAEWMPWNYHSGAKCVTPRFGKVMMNPIWPEKIVCDHPRRASSNACNTRPWNQEIRESLLAAAQPTRSLTASLLIVRQ